MGKGVRTSLELDGGLVASFLGSKPTAVSYVSGKCNGFAAGAHSKSEHDDVARDK